MEMEMAPAKSGSSACSTVVNQEPEEAHLHTSPCQDIKYVAIKEEPLEEVDPRTSPHQEIEYVAVKEETVCKQEWEVPDGNDSMQDPLSIDKDECSSSEDFLSPSTFHTEKTEYEEDKEALSEGSWEELKDEVESRSSATELESSILVDVDDDESNDNNGSLVSNMSQAAGKNLGIQCTTKQEASCGDKSSTSHLVHRCGICKRSFTHFEELKQHVYVDRCKRVYSCSVCHKTFTESGNLKSHIRVHTGERPYSCSVCNKTFKQSGHLKAHSLLHTGERPYSCTDCKRTFKKKGNLKQHLLLHTRDG